MKNQKLPFGVRYKYTLRFVAIVLFIASMTLLFISHSQKDERNMKNLRSTDNSVFKRITSLEKVDNQDSLYNFVMDCKDAESYIDNEEVVIATVNKISTEVYLFDIATVYGLGATEVAIIAVKKITTQRYLEQIAQMTLDLSVCKVAMKKIEDKSFLAKVAMYGDGDTKRLWAFYILDDVDLMKRNINFDSKKAYAEFEYKMVQKRLMEEVYKNDPSFIKGLAKSSENQATQEMAQKVLKNVS